MDNFGDRLAEANRQTQTPLCMGIDPHVSMIPKLFGNAAAEAGSDEALSAIANFCDACVKIATGRVPAIKPQAAFFEMQGPKGMQILQDLGRTAIDAGLLVIMDAKRGDIGSTSSAYAAAWMGHDALFPSDALTINPWLGIDTLEPFISKADTTNSGLFILNRTSNPGAGDLQDRLVDDKPLYMHLAKMLAPIAEARVGTSGWSAIGIVAGATWPAEANALRSTLPNSPFLVPGFGAQGAGPEKALAGLHRDLDHWQGGLINSTRGLIFPESAQDVSSIDAWNSAILAKIDTDKLVLNSV
ncbi:MAG: orotidine-5'-phosphate decarboxylase [Candidatus Puniceispirillum sp.]|uniref:orotidine-5'-phosphate decarboxylase n=1 Tax=Candidatus Puniceispirillum sp. TaxID=2026719 RepID=UPI001EB49120|nr:orotidine-5'-phosphate decarboxylase [Candidatus Puniceispirillum sp.]MBT6415380.1 orotidine-5'-phosphate decarboxylase [Candidatus Puniceispirillum sp.]